MAARFCYSESCCPAFHLLCDSLLLSQEGQYSSATFRLISQIRAGFLWMHTRVRLPLWRGFSCSGTATVCQSDSTVCTNGTFCTDWFIEKTGVSEKSCRKVFLINETILIWSTGTGREMLLQMVRGADFPLSSWDYCFLWRLLSFHRESLLHSRTLDCRDPGSFRESSFGSCWADGWWREQWQPWVTGCGGADRRLNFTLVRWTSGGIWSLQLHRFERLAQFWSCCQLLANPCENTEVECLFLSVVIVKNCGLMLLQELLAPLFEGTFSSRSKSLKVKSWVSPAVVDGHFQCSRVLVGRLPITAHINKTYQEAFNLNNREVRIKWTNAHARLRNYYKRVKEGLVELWVHSLSSEALMVLLNLQWLFNTQTFIIESSFMFLVLGWVYDSAQPWTWETQGLLSDSFRVVLASTCW